MPALTFLATQLRRATVTIVPVTLLACRGAVPPDAYGNFEATEVVVAAQTSGPIQRFAVTEGARLDRGAAVIVIDTTTLVLEREQATAQRTAVTARLAELDEQRRVLDVQREIAARTNERTLRLRAANAATVAQADQAERDLRTVTAQLQALTAQGHSVTREADAIAARVAQVRDRIARATVANPRTGTVLAVYAREGEVVGPGQPLYRIADLDTLELRAYVSGAQLAAIKLGQVVQVHVQQGEKGLLTLPGTIAWIASAAEFTPTPVQTRDERASLVYAVRTRVPNRDGVLKIGMPGDVTLNRAAGATP